MANYGRSENENQGATTSSTIKEKMWSARRDLVVPNYDLTRSSSCCETRNGGELVRKKKTNTKEDPEKEKNMKEIGVGVNFNNK